MKVILSIKPQYANSIFEGIKKYEYRKQIFKKNVETVVVYASAPVKKVIGEFKIEYIDEDTPDELWLRTSQHSGISFDFFQEYFSNRKTAYAIKVSSTVLYDTPLDILETFGLLPPQSFSYIK